MEVGNVNQIVLEKHYSIFLLCDIVLTNGERYWESFLKGSIVNYYVFSVVRHSHHWSADEMPEVLE